MSYRLTIISTSIVYLFIFLFYLFSCCGVWCESIKIWSLDSNRHEVNKWLRNGNLCPLDRIIYPDESVIYVDKLKPNQQIVLPNNGEIILDDNFDLSQINYDEVKSDCQPVDRRFSLISGEWMDPSVWNQTIGGHVISGDWVNNPIPHVDRIPCTQDRVVFPQGSTFQVYVDSMINNLNVKSIEINGITLDNEEFQSFLSSKIGRYVFAISSSQNLVIGPKANDCDTGSGCPCEYRDSKFINWMCKRVKCKPIDCKNPIKPEGHCCPLCGGLIRLNEVPENADLTRLQNYFQNVWLRRYPMTVGYSSRSPRTGSLEVIITELRPSGLLVDRVQSLFSELSDKENGFNPGFSYKSAYFQSSDFIDDSSISLTLLWIFILLVIFVAVGFVLYRYRFGVTITSLWNRSAFANSQFTFIRFQGLDESERVGLELGLANQSRPTDQMNFEPTPSSRSSVRKSTSALFSISEEKVSITDETNKDSATITNGSKSNDQVELETDLEPRSTHDKALLLDVVSLDQD